MNLTTFDSLIGQDSYVRCSGKKRIDSAIVSKKRAEEHLFAGGQIGWWVRTGYIIVDIDEGKRQALKIVKELGLNTLMAQTPKGLHLYFKCDQEFPQRVGMILPCGLKCDFRCANKGYVILPFGQEDRKFNRCREIAELPLEWTPMANRKDSLLNLKEGDGRNATLFSHLMAYKNRGASDEQIERMAEVINKCVFRQGMDQKELDRIVENTKHYQAQIPAGENPYIIYTDKGKPSAINSRAICDYFVNRGDIFVLGGECYQYREGVYEEASSYIRSCIKDMVMVDALIEQSKIMSCYRLICDDIRLQKRAEELNYDKNLINFKNGVYDIQSGKMIPHDSKYLQTIQIPHEIGLYKPFEQTRLYQFFQLTKMPKEDIKMILEYMAYCLTLDYGLKTFMILYGRSNTGKSVLIRFIENMVGHQNVSSLSMHELSKRFYPAQLYSRLLNSCADNSSLPLSSIDQLKKITGGDQIMHEKKGKEPFFFVSFAKLLFSFNQLPLQLEEKSNAFYKRMRILHMDRELFLNNEYVDDLCSNESIEEVLPYLLSLLPLDAIRHTRRSDDLVESLRQDSDSIHAFIAKRCRLDKDAEVSKIVFYQEYCDFCINSGREAHKKHAFMRTMRAQGFREGRRAETREPVWLGIKIRKKKGK